VDVKKLIAVAVREQIARRIEELGLKVQNIEQRIERGAAPAPARTGPRRVDVLSQPAKAPTGPPAGKSSAPPREIPARLRAILGPDWKAIRQRYEATHSVKQTAAEFEVSINTLKARIRREGWGQ
jgi:hypothetical protein